jgi:hypothetical protein
MGLPPSNLADRSDDRNMIEIAQLAPTRGSWDTERKKRKKAG